MNSTPKWLIYTPTSLALSPRFYKIISYNEVEITISNQVGEEEEEEEGSPTPISLSAPNLKKGLWILV